MHVPCGLDRVYSSHRIWLFSLSGISRLQRMIWIHQPLYNGHCSVLSLPCPDFPNLYPMNTGSTKKCSIPGRGWRPFCWTQSVLGLSVIVVASFTVPQNQHAWGAETISLYLGILGWQGLLVIITWSWNSDWGTRLPLSRGNKSLGNLVCLGLLGEGGSRHLSLASDWDTPGTDFTSNAILIQAAAVAGALDSDNGSELLGFEHLPF